MASYLKAVGHCISKRSIKEECLLARQRFFTSMSLNEIPLKSGIGRDTQWIIKGPTENSSVLREKKSNKCSCESKSTSYSYCLLLSTPSHKTLCFPPFHTTLYTRVCTKKHLLLSLSDFLCLGSVKLCRRREKHKIIFDNVSVFRVLYSITDGGASWKTFIPLGFFTLFAKAMSRLTLHKYIL